MTEIDEVAKAIMKDLGIETKFIVKTEPAEESSWLGQEDLYCPEHYSILHLDKNPFGIYFCYGDDLLEMVEIQFRASEILEDFRNYIDGGDEIDTTRSVEYLNVAFDTKFFTDEVLDSLEDKKSIIKLIHCKQFDVIAVTKSTKGCPDYRIYEVPDRKGWYYLINKGAIND